MNNSTKVSLRKKRKKGKRSKVVEFCYFTFSEKCEVEIPPQAASAKDQYTYYQLVFQPSNCSLRHKNNFFALQMNNLKVLLTALGHPEQVVEFLVIEGVGQFFSVL